MDDDIVRRLRFWSETRNNKPTLLNIDCAHGADEIERLRAELNKTHRHYAHLLMQFVSERNEAQRESKQLRKERDEARRMVCAAYGLQGRDVATERGWDCLKDGWDCGAEDQIPEAL